MRTLSKITLILGISLVLATGCKSDDSSDDTSTLLLLAALSQVQGNSCSSANLLAAGITTGAQALTFTQTAGTSGSSTTFSAFVPASALTTANTIRLTTTTTVVNTSAPLVGVFAYNGSSCADVSQTNLASSALATCTTPTANQQNCAVNVAGNYILQVIVSRGSGATLTSPPTDINILKL